LRRPLEAVDFDEMKGKTFTEIRVTEKLCEVCDKPIRAEEEVVRTVEISDYDSYSNLMTRQRAHDRVEVDTEEGKIYVYHHDYPGEVHPGCIEKL
jgi:hypothetical protein